MGTRRKTKRKTLAQPRVSYGVQNGTQILVTDNSGAKIAQIINVDGSKTRLRRLPKAQLLEIMFLSVSSF